MPTDLSILTPARREALLEQLKREEQKLLDVFLGVDQPRDVLSCLKQLAEAANHLLIDHDCDAHEHKEVDEARKAALLHVERIRSTAKVELSGRRTLIAHVRAVDECVRVRVYSGDQSEDWGLGTITQDMEIEGSITRYPARIECDNGRVTEGCECWWIPVERALEAAEERNTELEESAELFRQDAINRTFECATLNVGRERQDERIAALKARLNAVPMACACGWHGRYGDAKHHLREDLCPQCQTVLDNGRRWRKALEDQYAERWDDHSDWLLLQALLAGEGVLPAPGSVTAKVKALQERLAEVERVGCEMVEAMQVAHDVAADRRRFVTEGPRGFIRAQRILAAALDKARAIGWIEDDEK